MEGLLQAQTFLMLISNKTTSFLDFCWIQQSEIRQMKIETKLGCGGNFWQMINICSRRV